MAGGRCVVIPWYATGFRGDTMEEELHRVSRAALRYGATGYELLRSDDDRYKFIQVLRFERKIDWQRYWDGPELIDLRAACQGFYQVPVLYNWHDVVAEGHGPGSNGSG
jgi:hypothetical protein